MLGYCETMTPTNPEVRGRVLQCRQGMTEPLQQAQTKFGGVRACVFEIREQTDTLIGNRK